MPDPAAPIGRPFPIVLSRAHINKILALRATVLVRTAYSRVGSAHEIHDGNAIRRNIRYCHEGWPEKQTDPFVFVIEFTEVESVELIDLPFPLVHRAGFDSYEDFYRDWLRRRKRIHVDSEVKICAFQIASEARYLHQKIHRGYTVNQQEAVPDEPAALTTEELAELTEASRERWDREHRDEINRRTARSLSRQLREAHATAELKKIDVSPEIEAIQRQLDQIKAKLRTAA